MATLLAQRRAVRPLPFANGWIRTHSACTQAQRSTIAASWSTSGSCPIGSSASNLATSSWSFASKRASSSATFAEFTPKFEPAFTWTFSSPGSPRNAPTNPESRASKPSIARVCQRLAASSVGVLRCDAHRAISWSICERFLRNCGLSSSQLGTEKISNHALDGSHWLKLSADEFPLYRLSLNRVFDPHFGFEKGVDCVLEIRILLSIIPEPSQMNFQS